MIPRALTLPVLLVSVLVATPNANAAEVSGPVVITGHGPERPMIEDLAKAFEKAHSAAYVDIIWSRNAKIVKLVKSGEADLAVAGQPEPGLTSHQIAWDGIAIMINTANSTSEVTTSQVADIFSGKVKYWSELGGPDDRIRLINRHRTQNLTHYFEHALKIVGQIPATADVVGPEQKATNKVVGTLKPYSAVTYMSLTPALKAVRTGAGVRLLPVDRVEPEQPTIKDGRYPLRRPVLLLTRQDVTPTVEAFIAFALSPKGQRIIDRSYTSLDGTR